MFTDEELKLKCLVQIEDRFICIMNQSVRQHFNSVFDLQINNSDLIVSNFVINGKVKSLQRVIKYVKEIKVLSTISAQNIRRDSL